MKYTVLRMASRRDYPGRKVFRALERRCAAAALAAAMLLGGGVAEAQKTVVLVDLSSPEVSPQVRRDVLAGLESALGKDGELEVRRVGAGGGGGGATTNVAREMRAHLQMAKTLSQRFKEDEALERLKQAETLFRNSLARTRDVNVLIEVLLARAKLEIDRGKKRAASWALTRVAVLDPSRTLDPGTFKPVTVRIYNNIRKKVARETGELRVKTTPSGLPIWVDGRRRGSGPAVLTLPAGEHFVHVGGGSGLVGRVVTVGWKRSAELALASAPPPSSDNDLRAIGKKANADFVLAVRVRPREGKFQVLARVVNIRTVDTPTTAKSKPFAPDGTTWSVSKLATGVLPMLGVVARKKRGDDGDGGDGGDGGDRTRKNESIFKTWWFWTIVGVAAAGGGVAIGVAAASADSNVRLRLSR
ncbi:MAG: PEGA domain-containing protein [Myxococcales bacterium]|nr:PEGA domain-containing protein [Myxococcales bacterium]